MNMQSPLEKMISMAKVDGAATKRHWKTTISADDLMPQEHSGTRQPLDEIVRDIAIAASIDPEIIRGRTNGTDLNVARRVAVSRARDQGYSLREIGAFFGNRDTSTVYRLVATFKDQKLRGNQPDRR